MTQLEKVQYTAKVHTLGAFSLLTRFLAVLFAATVSLAATAPVFAQQFAPTAPTVPAADAKVSVISPFPANLGETADPDAVRPFRINIREAALDDLRRRIAATKWPEREYVSDATQGVQLATMQKLANYWSKDYDWRKTEAKLNSYPQFVTNIDGIDIHFIHVRSKNPNALPVIITHGWPGSIIEQLKIIGPQNSMNLSVHWPSESRSFRPLVRSSSRSGSMRSRLHQPKASVAIPTCSLRACASLRTKPESEPR